MRHVFGLYHPNCMRYQSLHHATTSQRRDLVVCKMDIRYFHLAPNRYSSKTGLITLQFSGPKLLPKPNSLKFVLFSPLYLFTTLWFPYTAIRLIIVKFSMIRIPSFATPGNATCRYWISLLAVFFWMFLIWNFYWSAEEEKWSDFWHVLINSVSRGSSQSDIWLAWTILLSNVIHGFLFTVHTRFPIHTSGCGDPTLRIQIVQKLQRISVKCDFALFPCASHNIFTLFMS